LPGWGGRPNSLEEHLMRGMIPKKWLALAALLTAALIAAPTTADEGAAKADKAGFHSLFNGKDFTGWKFYLPGGDVKKTWSIKDGIIICTGHPNGYFYTDKKYSNYVISYDWKYIKAKEGEKSSYNSGLLIHIHPPEKVWPKCVEVQGANANHAFFYFLDRKDKGTQHYDKDAKEKATHPIGEWNTTEAVCKGDGSITAKINGVLVNTGKSMTLTEGQIGFQSEGAEIHFRNIRIKELKE
jgi:hypothetical protein